MERPPEQPSEQPLEFDAEAARNLLRLALGGAVEGSAALLRRLEQEQAAMRSSETQSLGTESPGQPSDTTDLQRLRYALVGLLFEAPDAVGRTFNVLESATRKSAGLASRILSPVTNSRVARPLVSRYDDFIEDRLSAFDRWVSMGRREEQTSRELVLRLTDDEIDAVIDYLAEKPEVRGLVQQQTTGMAQEAVGELRGRSVNADRLIERVLLAGLKRRDAEVEPAPPPNLPRRKQDEGRSGHQRAGGRDG
jgi:hypothetical protein